MKNILTRIEAMLNSRRFFWAMLVFFILESAWIALSAAYPQAFDESFHFGLIKTYAHYWLPFLSSQPAGADAYGAMFRDPSYLYHYLMSFPYRLIALVIHDQAAQVIVMRFLNIALAATGFVLFRRVLLRAGLSRAFANVCLLIFALIPIVPQLAGQINYDNLLFPLVAWTCMLVMQVTDEFAAKRPSARTLITLVVVCLFASIVKYEFLPIALAAGLFVIYLAVKNFRRSWRKFGAKLLQNWRDQSWLIQSALVLAFALSAGPFVQRDGINLVRYHAIEPNCSAVLSVQSCNAYSPWAASYTWHQQIRTSEAAGTPVHFAGPVAYTASWFYWLWYRLFFAVSGPPNFVNYPPLPLPAAAAVLLGVFGAVALVLRRKLLRDNPYMLFFGIAIVVYLAALWISGYLQYRYTDVPVLMNGRYILPILLLVAVIIGRPIASVLRHKQTLKTSLAALTLIFFLQGGGVLTFIIRSDASWDWPNSVAVKANNAARAAAWPVIVTGNRSYGTSIWLFN